MIRSFVESGFPHLCDIIPLFLIVCSHGWPRVKSVLSRLIVAEEGALGEIYGNGATARAMRTCVHTYVPVHRIYAHADIYRACRKPLNLAADSHEIIGRERYISVISSTPTPLRRPIKQALGYHGRTDDVFTILPVFTRR